MLFCAELPEDEPNCSVCACSTRGPDKVSVPKSETMRVVWMLEKLMAPETVLLPRLAKAPWATSRLCGAPWLPKPCGTPAVPTPLRLKPRVRVVPALMPKPPKPADPELIRKVPPPTVASPPT